MRRRKNSHDQYMQITNNLVDCLEKKGLMRHASTLQPYDQQINRLNHALVFLLKSYQEANKLGVNLFQILTQKKIFEYILD